MSKVEWGRYKINPQPFVLVPLTEEEKKKTQHEDAEKRLKLLLQEAERKHQKAEELLKEAEKKLKAAQKEAEKILKNALDDAKKELKKAEEEASNIIDGAKKEANTILEKAHQEAESIKKEAEEFKDKVFEEAREKGFKEGYENGKEEGLKVMREFFLRVKSLMDAVSKIPKKLVAKLEPEIVDVIINAVTKITKKVAPSEEVVIENIRHALQSISETDWVEIRINPGQEDFVKRHLPEIQKEFFDITKIEIKPDPSISEGGVRVLFKAGGVDLTVESQLERVSSVIREVAGAESESAEEETGELYHADLRGEGKEG